jgi:hypothetical protein
VVTAQFVLLKQNDQRNHCAKILMLSIYVYIGSCECLFYILSRIWVGLQRNRAFDSQRGQENVLLSRISTSPLGTTHPPIQKLPWAFFSRAKRQGRETDCSLQSSSQVNNSHSTLPYVVIALRLTKAEGQLHFYLV